MTSIPHNYGLVLIDDAETRIVYKLLDAAQVQIELQGDIPEVLIPAAFLASFSSKLQIVWIPCLTSAYCLIR